MAGRKRGDRLTLAHWLQRRLVAVTFVLFRTLVLVLPRHWDPALGWLITRIIWFLQPKLFGRMLDHLRLVYGDRLSPAERYALAVRIVDHFGRTVTEFMRMVQTSPEEVRRRTRVLGQGALRQAERTGRGVIMVTGHYGNFEMMAANCGAYGLPILAIARSRDAELIEGFLAETRARHNITIVHKQSWREAVQRLREGGMVGLLADQAVRTGGTLATFMGHPAPTPLGPLLMARHSGSLLIPAFIVRDANDRFTVEIHKPLALPDTGDEEADLNAGAQQLNDVVGGQIFHKPEEWLWLHRRWKQPRSLRRGSPKL
ncbi:MAG: lysophospholipid acyltransferase family protein, partial [Armatimonadetes bacterium]|nr:lysophospholipid acyltransferase family protein [Armatimonadota bacterium]